MHLTNLKTPVWEQNLDWRFLFTSAGVMYRVSWFIAFLEKFPKSSMHWNEISAALFKYEGYETMPRKGQKKNEQGTNNFGSGAPLLGWINVSLMDDDYPEIERIAADRGKLSAGILELAERGCDFGCKWQDNGQSFMAYLIGNVADRETGRVGLSAFASSPADAIGALLYKYFGKLDGTLTSPVTSARPRFR